MARRGVKTAIRVGQAAPLVLGALALDPGAALAASCDATTDGTVNCSDETLGDLAIATHDGAATVDYRNEAVRLSADVTREGFAVSCVVCTIDLGDDVKGHPACISGYDPVVDPWIAETVSEVLRGGTS